MNYEDRERFNAITLELSGGLHDIGLEPNPDICNFCFLVNLAVRLNYELNYESSMHQQFSERTAELMAELNGMTELLKQANDRLKALDEEAEDEQTNSD